VFQERYRHRGFGACVCQHHWLDFSWLDYIVVKIY